MNARWAMWSVAAAVLVALAPGAARGEAAPRDVDVLVVSGSGQVRVVPDRAMVRVGVETRAPAAGDAIKENNRVMAQVVDAIRKLDIPADAIQTAQFNVGREYEPQPPNSKVPPRAVYVVSNMVSVRLEDPTRAGAVIDSATTAGANNVQGVSFFTEKEAAARQQALQNAMRDAQAKAQALADAAGVRLGAVESIVESGGVVPVAQRFGVMAEAVQAPTPIFPGENTITANVMVRYRIAR